MLAFCSVIINCLAVSGFNAHTVADWCLERNII